MTNADHQTDDHGYDAPQNTTSGIEPKEEEAIDKALQTEDESDEAAAEETVASDEDQHDAKVSE